MLEIFRRFCFDKDNFSYSARSLERQSQITKYVYSFAQLSNGTISKDYIFLRETIEYIRTVGWENKMLLTLAMLEFLYARTG